MAISNDQIRNTPAGIAEQDNTQAQTAQQSAQPIPLTYEIPEVPRDEARDGTSAAVWAYFLNLLYLPFFLIPFIRRNNQFALFHAKQAAVIWAGYPIVFAAMFITSLYRPEDFRVREIFERGLGVLLWMWAVLNVVGLLYVRKYRMTPLPIVGRIAQRLFSRIVPREPTAAR